AGGTSNTNSGRAQGHPDHGQVRRGRAPAPTRRIPAGTRHSTPLLPARRHAGDRRRSVSPPRHAGPPRREGLVPPHQRRYEAEMGAAGRGSTRVGTANGRRSDPPLAARPLTRTLPEGGYLRLASQGRLWAPSPRSMVMVPLMALPSSLPWNFESGRRLLLGLRWF